VDEADRPLDLFDADDSDDLDDDSDNVTTTTLATETTTRIRVQLPDTDQGRRLSLVETDTRLRILCYFSASSGVHTGEVTEALDSLDFTSQLLDTLTGILDNSSSASAILGDLVLQTSKVREVDVDFFQVEDYDHHPSIGTKSEGIAVPWWGWVILSTSLIILCAGNFIARCCARMCRRKRKSYSHSDYGDAWEDDQSVEPEVSASVVEPSDIDVTFTGPFPVVAEGPVEASPLSKISEAGPAVPSEADPNSAPTAPARAANARSVVLNLGQ